MRVPTAMPRHIARILPYLHPPPALEERGANEDYTAQYTSKSSDSGIVRYPITPIFEYPCSDKQGDQVGVIHAATAIDVSAVIAGQWDSSWSIINLPANHSLSLPRFARETN